MKKHSRQLDFHSPLIRRCTPPSPTRGEGTKKQFQTALLTWFKQHGRKDLPWQKDIAPYRVWISEIMLQQTQVKTVIPYFNRFMQQFPDINQLAAASIDEVLHLWSGLGYYSRARNIHHCAQIIVNQYQGKFPNDVATLQTLPGIGRSTAGAILSIAYKKSAAILDGNVKRVLTRVHAVPGWPGDSKIQKQLWELAEFYTPTIQTAAYTQAIMDLGATVCTRSQPQCSKCPLTKDCIAYQQNRVQEFPHKKLTKKLPVKQAILLILQYQGKILLEKRPPVGVWGGLWSAPECEMDTKINLWCKQRYGLTVKKSTLWPTFRHTFSHFHFDITPLHAFVEPTATHCMDQQTIWYNTTEQSKLGFSAVMKRLLQSLITSEVHNGTNDLLSEIETTE